MTHSALDPARLPNSSWLNWATRHAPADEMFPLTEAKGLIGTSRRFRTD